ncbi:AAA family ATPase [Mycoplasma tauri]|uniref:AAA family ATPase n=1 Tax=Mycoplasma tauri TaxID=547987 RepID=UPI001CBC83B8|nr:AAA family ATPase [Mycoplasma tauri]MBZ4212434.1 AAA family ATPase [Mycoplasma tauri]MBZ4218138.1 AAA family ATPase [Mycoplasma tauri]
MKLIKVEAHGFKSFADPITLKFDGGVAGIVGPNGSGKSNINDAIKWVLGERSAKELRGDNMDDVIFAGSKTAKPLNKAVVTLTFDNKDGLSSIPHEIVTISRVLERGNGINQYYLNGEVCRQKDIREIAMESGIGKSSLAIISQGTVSDIAEATPEERKAIFEEAAGVSKYKFRKKEALSKLAKTQEGLDQINLVIAEIERKLVPLRRQAEKAKIYISKTEELKVVEVGLLVDNIRTFGEKYETLSKELEGVSETKADLNKRISDLELKINQNTQFKSSLESELKELSIEYDSVKERLQKINIAMARESERDRLIADGNLVANKEEQIASFKSLLEKSAQRINYYEAESKALNIRISENRKVLESYENELNNLGILLNKKDSEIFKVQTHISLLKQQKENSSMLFKGTKTILENKAFFGKSLKGTVADLIKVEPQYTSAIEVVLNNALQHLVVDKSETAVKAVEFLKQNKGGRATFIPLTSIQPKNVRDDHLLAIQGQPGFVGIASNLIQINPIYDILAKFLLGNVIVTSDIKQANKISEILDRRYMIVTLEGDIIRAGGVIVGGTKSTTETLLNIDDKLKDLENLLPGLEAAIAVDRAKQNEIYNYRRSCLELDSQLKNQVANVISQKSNEQAIFDELNLKLKNISDREIKLESDSVSIQSKESDFEVLSSRKSALEAEYRAKDERIKTLSQEINSAQMLKNDYDSTLRKLLDSFATKMADKEKSKVFLEQSRERLAAQYKLTFEAAQSQGYKLEMPHDQASEIVREIREEIEKLGSINLEALEQLVEEEKRYNDYAESESELSKAKEILESAIADMDKIITTRLTNIIHDVNEEFNNVFATMFGGGSAKLFFSDPNNVLDSGVEIEATPPGKNIKNLKLFSGGEKSLIAISLLFGILKARPLPLCILDEVEAALDEANVVRYAEYLQQLKEKTQFLVITHRHGTMSRVDSLFGATMQNRGVTTFFSIQLADAKKLVDDEQKDYLNDSTVNN